MKEISEDYVSFETKKLLLKKGMPENFFNHIIYDKGSLDSVRKYYSCSLNIAMKWLRDEKRYYIQVMLDDWACGGHLGYYVVIQKTDSDFEMMLQDAVDEVFYQTYEEACEAAIKYVLENLI